MVVLTVTTTNNSHTVYFKEALRNPYYVRLLSCSLCNSWHNLKRDGQIRIYDNPSIDNYSPKTIPAGNYTIETLADELNKTFEEKSEAKIRTPKAALEINNPIGHKIEIDKDLISLLGIRQRIQSKNYINRLKGFNNHFVKKIF